MAGFVDGEGYLGIVKQVRRNRPSPAYRACITICNTRSEALKPFEEEYGGKLYRTSETRRDWDNVKWSDAFIWYCPVASSERLLTDLLRHLRLKKKQARLMLRFIHNKRAFDRQGKRVGRRGSLPLSPREIMFRERLRLQIRLLNRKGVLSRRQGRTPL